MEVNEKKVLPPLICFLFYSTLLVIWLIMVLCSYSTFQNTRSTEPYAEIKALFPHFFILLFVMAGSTGFFIRKYDIGKYSFIFILLSAALMLWYTPYLMSGFVKQTDTIWHMGMAANFPEIMGGSIMPYSSYLTSFPLSYSANFMFLEITGMELLTLANYVMPLMFIVMIVMLSYVVFSHFTDNRIAGIAALISFGMLHHISLHSSPQVIGFMIFFTAIILFIKKQ